MYLFDEKGHYQRGGLTYTLYDLNLDYTKNVMAEYSVYVVLNTAQSDRDYALFYKKAKSYQQGSVLVACDDRSSLWSVDQVCKMGK